jgi:hypothetical protein
MSVQHPLSTITLLSSLVFSASAHATINVWDTPNPWGAATPTDFASWDVFNQINDFTPDIAATGSAEFSFAVSGASIDLNGNVTMTGNNANPAYIGTLDHPGLSGLYDLYVRLESGKADPSSMTSTITFDQGTGNPPLILSGTLFSTVVQPINDEFEYYWVWNNVALPAGDAWQVNIAQNTLVGNIPTIIYSAELAAVAVAAVPEPETYAMFLAGLGLMGVVARRRNKPNALA